MVEDVRGRSVSNGLGIMRDIRNIRKTLSSSGRLTYDYCNTGIRIHDTSISSIYTKRYVNASAAKIPSLLVILSRFAFMSLPRYARCIARSTFFQGAFNGE